MAASSSTSRICRALKLVGIAISHILAGYPDSSRTALNAAWDDLKDSPIESIEYTAAAAFIEACDGNTRQAVASVRSVHEQLQRIRRPLPNEVQIWIQNTLYETLRRLPYARQLSSYLHGIRIAHTRKDYCKALCLLDEASNYLRPVTNLVPTDLRNALDNAWCAVLSDMLHDQSTWNHTTLRGIGIQYTTRVAAATAA